MRLRDSILGSFARPRPAGDHGTGEGVSATSSPTCPERVPLSEEIGSSMETNWPSERSHAWPREARRSGGLGDRAMNHLIKLSTQRGKIAGLCIALLLLLGISAERAGALAAGGQDNVRSFYATLLTTMKDGRTLGQSGRYARLSPVVDRVFDGQSMTRLPAGAPPGAPPPAPPAPVNEGVRAR